MSFFTALVPGFVKRWKRTSRSAAEAAAPAALTCRELVELVTEYVEGALAPAELGRFDAHLRACDGCAAYLAQMRQTIRLTGLLREDDVPAEARQRLLGAFRDWKATPPSGPTA